MKEIRIGSWNDLSDQLYAGAWQESIGRFRSTEVYRGLRDAAHDLTTSLMRLGRGYEVLEGHLLRTFRRYAHRYATPGDSIWHWLAVAQHHGLPTRLIDWTYSPFVALHFATERPADFHCDAAVWCVNFVEANKRLPRRLKAILDEEHSDT